jgi:hypothetical protein
MTIAAIRQRLITIIADADDKKVKAIYTLLADDQKENDTFTLSDEHVAILDEERAKHLRGESKSYTWEEAKQIIRGKK